jgi:hypothetical protein
VPELENTWPKRLERLFADVGRPELRVLNLGVGGYQPLQEARLLELRGLALEPDLVLVLVSLNDPTGMPTAASARCSSRPAPWMRLRRAILSPC